jgi:hypothetical protein
VKLNFLLCAISLLLFLIGTMPSKGGGELENKQQKPVKQNKS